MYETISKTQSLTEKIENRRELNRLCGLSQFLKYLYAVRAVHV